MIRIYSPLLDTPERRAHNLLERLKMGDIRHGTKTRDVWRKGWTGLNTADDLAKALDILEPLGWVRRVMIKSSGPGVRPRVAPPPGVKGLAVVVTLVILAGFDKYVFGSLPKILRGDRG